MVWSGNRVTILSAVMITLLSDLSYRETYNSLSMKTSLYVFLETHGEDLI